MIAIIIIIIITITSDHLLGPPQTTCCVTCWFGKNRWANPIWTQLRTSSRLLCSFLYAEFYLPFLVPRLTQGTHKNPGERGLWKTKAWGEALELWKFRCLEVLQRASNCFFLALNTWISPRAPCKRYLNTTLVSSMLDSGVKRRRVGTPLACCHCMISIRLSNMSPTQYQRARTNGYGSIPIHTIFSGMNIHKSKLFWCELQGYYWFWHTAKSLIIHRTVVPKETKEQCVLHIIPFSCLLFFALQARSMAGDRQFAEIELALSYSRHAYCVS